MSEADIRSAPSAPRTSAFADHALGALAARVGGLKALPAGLLAAGLGALGVLAHAPFHVWPAFAVALCGLAWLLAGAASGPRPLRAGFWRTWAFGFGHFLAGMFWVGNAFLVDAEKFAALMPFAVSLLPAGLAMFWGVAGAACARLWPGGVAGPAWMAACLALAEVARGHLFTGLPWNLPAYVWVPGGWVSQAASVIGPYGLGALTVFVLAAPAALAWRTGWATLAAAAVLCTGLAGFGAWRLSQAPAPSVPSAGAAVIAVGQAGFSQKDVWDPANTDRLVQTYLDMLDDPAAARASVIVWPEGAFPFLLAERADVLEAIGARLRGRSLVVGAVRRDIRDGRDILTNSMLVIAEGADGLALRGLYDKYHLVPFGEYLPLRPLFERFGLDSLVSYNSDFTPGPAPGLIEVPGAGLADARVCYEIVFPSFNDASRSRARLILNVSIDAWYGDALGPDQHFAQARYRAIESGLPLARAASGGWSGIVDPWGRVVAARRDGPGHSVAGLPPALAPSIFARHPWAATAAAFGLLVLAMLLLTTVSRGSRLTSAA